MYPYFVLIPNALKVRLWVFYRQGLPTVGLADWLVSPEVACAVESVMCESASREGPLSLPYLGT